MHFTIDTENQPALLFGSSGVHPVLDMEACDDEDGMRRDNEIFV